MHASPNSFFGTDGIRARIGTNLLTLESLPLLGTALAQWITQRYGSHPNVLLAHDTRNSCAFVKSALKSGLLLSNITVHDAQVLPTPAVFKLIEQNKQFHCGIIISASHNPFYDNGIKLIDARTGKLNQHDEQEICALFNALKPPTYTEFGNDIPFNNAQETYITQICSAFPSTLLANKIIALDCANGATSHVAPLIFKALGAQIITTNAAPNGANINHECGALYPQQLQELVLCKTADAGFAFDGDGDRVIMVNKHGHIKDGDDILALLLTHPLYQHTRSVVGTVMTNQGFETYLKKDNRTLIRVPVGDKYITERLEHDALLLGGEQSGHIIMRDYLPTGDGIFTALRVLQALQMTGNWHMNTFKKYPQILVNIPVRIKKDLTLQPLKTLIDQSSQLLHTGRLLVRYSGTENLLRIMAEDDDLHRIQEVVTVLSEKLEKELS